MTNVSTTTTEKTAPKFTTINIEVGDVIERRAGRNRPTVGVVARVTGANVVIEGETGYTNRSKVFRVVSRPRTPIRR